MNAFIKGMKNYAVFSGRSSRSDYWFFMLFLWIFFFVGIIIFDFADMLVRSPLLSEVFGFVFVILVVGIIIPTYAVLFRRLHDTNRSGWRLLITLVPLVGHIVFIVYLCQPSDAGDNRFGPNPHTYGGTSPGFGQIARPEASA